VNYVRERIGQTEQWAKRGTTILGDLLRSTVGHLHTATFLSPKDMLMLIGCTHPSSGIRGAQTAVFELDIRTANPPYIDVCQSLASETGSKSRNVEKRINAV
jgi:hypothetical protein